MSHEEDRGEGLLVGQVPHSDLADKKHANARVHEVQRDFVGVSISVIISGN